MSDTETIKLSSGIYGLYCLFAVIYAFMKWGFWWGVLNMIVPFAPIVDLIKYFSK